MRNFEDHFVERKTSADSKDWLKTVVGFANSAPNNFPCVLYVGVKNDGEIESPQVNLDSLQRTFNKETAKAYPPVPCFPRVIQVDGRQALAIIVFGSEQRPHFTGLSYVRQGSETVHASEAQFEELIARRNAKADKLLAFKGKPVTVVNRQRVANQSAYESMWSDGAYIVECNQFWVTIAQAGGDRTSFPLSRVEINFDNQRDRLRVELER
jgi:predicted HTH transcriptional regulator